MNPFQNFWGEPEIGIGTKIAAFVEIGAGVSIGKNCKIEAFSFIPPGVTIGNNVFIGPHVCFTNDKYPELADQEWSVLSTVVKDNVTIGAGAVILPGIVLGKGCFIGAGAVVTKSVPDLMTVVGNPAKELYTS